MEHRNEVPMFVDVDRGPDYSELENILKAPIENSTVGQQQMSVYTHRPQQTPQPQSTALSQPPPEKTEPKPRIRCPECRRYTTDDEDRMVRHIRKNHRGENPFQCTMCDYSTYNKSLFEEHERIHKGIKPFKCAHCPYRSVSKKNRNKHELIHRKNNPLKCEQCPFIAHHIRSLICHKQKHENEELDVKNEEDSESENLQCEECGFKFVSRLAFDKHKNNYKSRVCDLCGDRFCSLYYLRKHNAAVHDARKEIFKCEVCGWSGSMKMKVLLHLIHHPQQVDETVFDLSVLKKHGISQ